MGTSSTATLNSECKWQNNSRWLQPCFSSIDHDDKLIAVHGLAGLVGGADAAELLDSPGIVVNYRERKSNTVNLQALTIEKKIAKTMLPLTSVSLCLRIAPPRTLNLVVNDENGYWF